jgi:hypothetical protein
MEQIGQATPGAGPSDDSHGVFSRLPATAWGIAVLAAFLHILYLAFAKRRQELLTIAGSAADHRRVLGKHSVSYLDQVNITLAGAAIVCYALYTVAPDPVERFGTDGLIFGTVFVVYGLLRYMALIQKPVHGGDPSKVMLRDGPLRLATIGWAIYNGLVIYRDPLLALWGLQMSP